jgi:hypothetical protein
MCIITQLSIDLTTLGTIDTLTFIGVGVSGIGGTHIALDNLIIL